MLYAGMSLADAKAAVASGTYTGPATPNWAAAVIMAGVHGRQAAMLIMSGHALIPAERPMRHGDDYDVAGALPLLVMVPTGTGPILERTNWRDLLHAPPS